jgi:hypothetical protein
MSARPPAARKLLFWLVLAVWTLVLVEGMAAAYFLFFSRTYYRPLYLEQRNDQWLWRTERDDWGAWHKPSSTANHIANCFTTTYRSNSYGARDRERSIAASGKRAVVLGDSFIEGYAVDEDRRMSSLLEARLGFEMLNFGMTSFGPLQYEILYDRLARRFEHDLVVVGFLPENDFIENDLDFQSRNRDFATRYRPLYGKGGGVVYPRPRPGPDEPPPFGKLAADLPERRGWRNIYHLFWLYGLYREVRYNVVVLTHPTPSTYIGYFETDDTRIANATRSLLAIRRAAAPRPVLVVFIPEYKDLRHVETHPGSEKSSVVARMRPVLEASGIRTIDLLTEFRNRGLATEAAYRPLYLPCDGHWNDAGHRAAFEVVEPVVGDLLRTARPGQEGRR